jgi:sugar phosphate isomerase/epimerase
MNYSSRVDIARHGFESVTLKLAKDYQRYKEIAEKHGIEISAQRVTKILRQADEQRESVTAWRRIFEQTTGALLRQSGQ